MTMTQLFVEGGLRPRQQDWVECVFWYSYSLAMVLGGHMRKDKPSGCGFGSSLFLSTKKGVHEHVPSPAQLQHERVSLKMDDWLNT